MDNNAVTIILTALTSGAAASVKETTSAGVKDTYSGLKNLLQRRVEGKPKAQAALENHEEDPETYEKPLAKALADAYIDQDQEILEVAKHLMALVHPQQVGMGKYNIQITGNVQGYAQGDHQQVNMHFGNESSKE